MIAALDVRLDITRLDPRQEAWSDENIVNTRAIVRFAGRQFSVPTFVSEE